MDLSKLSEADLRAIAGGDTNALSGDGRLALASKTQDVQQQTHTTSVGSGVPTGPVTEMSGPQRFRAGIGRNFAAIGRNVGNLVGLIPDQQVKDANQLDEQLLATPGGASGDMFGNLVSSLPIGAGVGGGVSRLGSIGARVAANPISRGAIEGAAQGVIQAAPGERAKGAFIGGLAGGSVPATVAAGRKLANPIDIAPASQRLLNEGIDLSPGQLNPKGIANKIESDYQSVPVIGTAIQSVRKAAETQYKKKLITEVAAPGAKVKDSADLNAMLDDAYKSFGPAYDVGKGYPVAPSVLRTQGGNEPLTAALNKIGAKPRIGLTDADRKSAVAVLQNKLKETLAATGKNGLDSGDLLKYRSLIREQSRNLSDGSNQSKALRDMLSEADDKVTEVLESQLPPDAMKALAAVDGKYANYKIVEDAVRRGGDKEFTPFQASQAVRNSAENGKYARGGGGPLRDLTKAGAETFSDTPVTGARLASIGIPIAAIGAAPHIAIPAAGAAAAAVLTKTGRKFAAGQTGMQKGMRALEQKVTNSGQQIDPRALETVYRVLNGLPVAGATRSQSGG